MAFKDGELIVMWFANSRGVARIWRIFRENTSQYFSEEAKEWKSSPPGQLENIIFSTCEGGASGIFYLSLEQSLEEEELCEPDRQWLLGAI